MVQHHLSDTDGRRATALSRRRRVVFAAAAFGLVFVASCVGLLALDWTLHRRVQYLAGVNVWGYRGDVVGKKKPGERRIVVVGGSTAFGYGVPWNQAFPYYLERDLNASRGGDGSFSVVNLGAPNQGAYGFLFDLSDYRYLDYDVAILYEGYNDLGARDLPEAVPPRTGPNQLLWRRQSPIFRATGYFPILPLVFREKAMALRAGGDLDGAYRGRVAFQPGLATRATAETLKKAADIADMVGTRLGRLSDNPKVQPVSREDFESWKFYVACELAAVAYSRSLGAGVLVVTQPYASDTHVRQQSALAAAVKERFGGDRAVQYVNLGPLLNIRDRDVAYDGLHLVAKANQVVAARLQGPVLDLFR